MKKPILLLGLLCIWIASCNKEEEITQKDQAIKFSFAEQPLNGLDGGRTQAAAEPAGLIITIADNSGAVVADRKELSLHKFGDGYLSLPLMLKTSGATGYLLTEFLVTDAGGHIIYATPREGSELAHLVADALDIEFVVTAEETTTVTPDVLEVTEDSDPADYGYGEFGFNVIKKITVLFSSFIKEITGNALTSSHLKVEGLAEDASNETAQWTYETDLEAKTNIVSLKEAARYRITATKEGYPSWTQTAMLTDEGSVDIFFEKGVDVYVAGRSWTGSTWVATYWKNQNAFPLSTHESTTNQILVVNNDVYVTGSDSGTETAFYWKNGQQIFFSEPGITTGIALAGSDLYVIGYQTVYFSSTRRNNTIPVYWKNGVMQKLGLTSPARGGFPSAIVVDGPDVYISGREEELPLEGQTYYYPAIWKNGAITALPVPSPGYNNSLASDMKIKEGHIYISGHVGIAPNQQPAYWVDGVLTVLPESKSSQCDQIDVENGDIYVAGMQLDAVTHWKGKYWKNSEEHFIEPDANVNLYAIAVLDGHVYLAGDYRNPPVGSGGFTGANYWVDGQRFPCGEESSFAFSMAVVSK